MAGPFDAKTVFKSLEGPHTVKELRTKLVQVRTEHAATLPAEVDVPALIELGRDNKWLIEKKDGGFFVSVE